MISSRAVIFLVAFVSLSPIAWGSTIFHYHFDERAVGTTLAVDDEFADAQGGAAAAVKKTKNSPTAPKIADGVPFKIYDPVAKTSYTSTGSVRFALPAANVFYYLDIPSRTVFNGSAFTIEGFFRLDPNSVNHNGMWDGRIGAAFFRRASFWRFGVNQGDFWATISSSAGGVAGTMSGLTVPGTQVRFFEDGLWHHVAVVYDGSTVKCYADRYLMTTIACGALDFGESTDSILIGNSGNSSYNSPFPGWIDEIRYSDVALTPDQFLMPLDETVSGDTLGWWRFEQGSKSRCERFPNSVQRETALLENTAGATSRISDMNMGLKADDETFSNTNAVKGGYMLIRDNPMFSTTAGFTVESFFKWDVLANGQMVDSNGGTVYLMGKGPNASSQQSANCLYVWAGSSDSNTKYLKLKIGSETKTGAKNIHASLANGWHHLALTYDPAGPTAVLYFDYQEELRWENCPALPAYDPQTSRAFVVGTDVNNSSGHFGKFKLDEIRITKGVLTVEKFLDPVLGTDGLKKGDVIAHWAFDTDTMRSVGIDGACDGSENFSWRTSGTEPAAHVVDVVNERRPFVKASSGLRQNLGSLAVKNGYFVVPFMKAVSRDSKSIDAMTIEYFTSANALAQYGLQVGFRVHPVAWSTMMMATRLIDANGKLSLWQGGATDTPLKNVYPVQTVDVWHHIAYTMRKTGNVDVQGRAEQAFQFYYDRQLVKEWTSYAVSDLLNPADQTGFFLLGGLVDSNCGLKSGVGYDGYIDELRLSYGALEPREFLRQSSGKGAVIFLR